MSTSTTTSGSAARNSAIFLVEDEPVLRSSLARGLSRLTNVDVLAAGTVGEAMAFLGTRPPSILISDIDLPGPSGLELVAELARRDIEVPIILVTAYLNTYRHQIPTKHNLTVLEKPIPLDDLRSRVKQLLRSTGSEPRPLGNLLDCVQATCTKKLSAAIDVELESATGRVIVYQGEVWSAADARGSGPGAFQRLAFAPDDSIHYSPLTAEPGPRNINARWERLVLDLACDPGDQHIQRIDQRAVPAPRSGRARAQTLPGMPQVRPEDMRANPAAVGFDELWSAGIDALLRKDYACAARAFKAAGELRRGHSGVLANLRRLRQLGYDAGGDENGN